MNETEKVVPEETIKVIVEWRGRKEVQEMKTTDKLLKARGLELHEKSASDAAREAMRELLKKYGEQDKLPVHLRTTTGAGL